MGDSLLVSALLKNHPPQIADVGYQRMPSVQGMRHKNTVRTLRATLVRYLSECGTIKYHSK